MTEQNWLERARVIVELESNAIKELATRFVCCYLRDEVTQKKNLVKLTQVEQ